MELTLPSEHVHIDFNKICRICLSTEGLLPISMPLYYDQNSIRGKNIFCNTVEFVLTKYAHIKVTINYFPIFVVVLINN